MSDDYNPEYKIQTLGTTGIMMPEERHIVMLRGISIGKAGELNACGQPKKAVELVTQYNTLLNAYRCMRDGNGSHRPVSDALSNLTTSLLEAHEFLDNNGALIRVSALLSIQDPYSMFRDALRSKNMESISDPNHNLERKLDEFFNKFDQEKNVYKKDKDIPREDQE